MNETTRRAGKPRRKATPGESAATPIVTPPTRDETPSLRLLARVPISVRWRDLDAFNHVNNATFLSYLEEARLVWLSQLRGPWFGETFLPVLAASDVNYRAPISWPGRIVVELYCGRLGKSSLTLSHRIVDAENTDQLYSDGSSVMVWTEPATGRSIPLPQVILDACQ